MLARLCLALFVTVSALDDADQQQNGVKKIIKMLGDMKAQLEKEASQDDEIMEKMNCWCTTVEEEKTKSIADAKASITQLETDIESRTAVGTQLKDDLEQLTKDVAENEMELAQATSIREKENADFVEAEKNQMMSITGLTKAVAALEAKIGGGASLSQVKKAVSESMDADAKKKFLEQIAQLERKQSFLQIGEKEKLKAPASAEVFGVLKQMKESFETSLKDSQADEADAAKAYDEMKAAKDAEITSGKDVIDSKSKQAAENVEMLAQAKVDLKDTSKQLSADETFLASAQDRCGNMDQEFADRKKMRTEEIAAVGEALGILTSDDAHDQFNKSLNFIQKRSVQGTPLQRARVRAARLFLEAGVHSGSPRLSELAVTVRTDVFAKVKQAISDMLGQLKTEQDDERKHKDWCIDELNSNDKQTTDGYDAQDSLAVQLEELTLEVKKLKAEIAASTKQIADTLLEMKHAGEDRAAESKQYQETVADQKATQVILKKALDRLQAFYSKGSAALVQAHYRQGARQAPPPGFGGSYEKNAGSTGVVMLLGGVIKESEATVSKVTATEQESQAAYEGYVKESNTLVDALNGGVSEKTGAMAKADEAIARTKKDQMDNLGELENLHNIASQLHKSCDFTIKNYELRQNARAEEMEALNQGLAILSGADPALMR
jgi:hypothetical protein